MANKTIIENNNILSKDGLIVLETDNLPREQEQISDLKKLYISDLRLYGRVKLIFLNYREG